MALDNQDLINAAINGPTQADYENRLLEDLATQMGTDDLNYVRNSINSVNPSYLANPVETLKRLQTGELPQQDLQNTVGATTPSTESSNIMLGYGQVKEDLMGAAPISLLKKEELNTAVSTKGQQLSEAVNRNKLKLNPNANIDVTTTSLDDYINLKSDSGKSDAALRAEYFELSKQSYEQESEKQRLIAAAYTERDAEEITKDTALSVAKFPLMVGETVYGVANLLTGGNLDNELNFGGNFQESRDIINEGQSYQSNAQRNYSQEEIAQLTKEEELLRDSTKDVFTKVASYAREYGKGAISLVDNPALLWDTVIESGLAFTVPAAVSAGVRKGVLNSLTAQQRKEFLADTAKMTALEKNEKLAALLTISGMEAGGNSLQVQSSILNTPFEELAQNSPLYQDLVAGGASPENARKQVAANAAITTYAFNFTGAGIVSKLTGSDKVAADLSKGLNTIGSRLFKVGSTASNELVEESGQSAVGQFAQNLGQSLADENQSLTEGVAASAGQGGISGGLSGGLVQSLVASSETAKDAITPLVQKGAEIAQDTAIAKQVEQAEASGDFSSLAPTDDMSSRDVLLRMKRLATAIVKEETIEDSDKINQINTVFEQLQDAYEDKATREKQVELLGDIKNNPDKYPEITDSLKVVADTNSTAESKEAAIKEVYDYALVTASNQVSKDLYEDESTDFNVAVKRTAAAYEARINIVSNKIKEGTPLTETEVSETVRTFGSNPDAFRLNDIDTFISSDSFKDLDNKSQVLVKAARDYKQSLADAEEVSNVIRNGGKLDGQEWRGLRTYVANFNTQFKRGNKQAATAVYEDLKRWYLTRKDKLIEWKAKPQTDKRDATIATMVKENTAMMATMRLMAAKNGLTVTSMNKGKVNEQNTSTTELPAADQEETIQPTEDGTVTASTETVTQPTTETLAQSGNTAEQPQAVTASVDTQADKPEASTHTDNSEINDTGLDTTQDTPLEESAIQKLVGSFKQYILPGAYKNLSFSDFYRLVQPKSKLGNNTNFLSMDQDEVNSVFDTQDLNPLGFKWIKSFTNQIKSGFNNIDLSLSDKDTTVFTQIRNNPIITLMSENGTLPDEITSLLSVALVKVLATNTDLQKESNEDSTIKSLFGIDKKSEVTGNTLNPARYAGTRTDRVTEAVSREIANVLGVKPLKTLGHEEYQRALNSLAGTVVAAAVSVNLIERVNVKTPEGNDLGFTRLTRNDNNKFNENSNDLINLGKQVEWFEKLFNENSILNKPSMLRPTKTNKGYSSNNPLVAMQTLPQQVQDILLRHSQRPNRILRDVFNYFEVLPADAQAIVAGVIPEAFFKDKHVYEQESIIAANQATQRTLDNFNEFSKEVGDSEFYFEHVMWANGRIGIDGSYINPQESKFVRHLANLSAFEVNVDQSDVAVMADFKAAVAVSFEKISGVALDKADLNTIEQGFNKLLQDENIQLVLADMESASFDNDESITRLYNLLAKAENPTQGFHALVALREMLNADGGNFTTTLSLEVDGKTNGFAFSALQFSSSTTLDDLTDSMERAGIYTTPGVNYKTWKVDGQNNDTYEVLAKVMSNVATEANQESQTGLAKVLATLVGFNVVDVTEEDGTQRKVRSYTISRSLAKNPVMVTMYGAGINGVIDNFINDVVNNMYKSISSTNAKDALVKSETIRALKAYTPEAFRLDDEVSNNTFTLSKEVEDKLKTDLKEQYTEIMKEALEVMFGDITTSRNKLVQASQTAHKVFKEVYNNNYNTKLNEINESIYAGLVNEMGEDKAKEAFKSFQIKTLNKHQIDELIESLAGKYPTFKSYFLDTNETGIVVSKTSNKNNNVEVFLNRNKFAVSYYSKKTGEYIPISYTVDSEGNVRFNNTYTQVLYTSYESNGETIRVSQKFSDGDVILPYASKTESFTLKNLIGPSLPNPKENLAIKYTGSQNVKTYSESGVKNSTTKSINFDLSNNSFDLNDPSVSMAPKAIHSLDGSVQLSIMKDVDMFNVHDAAYYPLGQVMSGAALANKAFQTVNNEYSIFASTEAMLEQMMVVANEYGINITELADSLTEIKKEKDSSEKVKQEFFSKVEGVYQYTYNLSEFNLKNDQRKLAAQELAGALKEERIFGSSTSTVNNFNADTQYDINANNVEAIYNALGSIGVQDPVQMTNAQQSRLNGLISGFISPLVQNTKLLIQKTAPETLGSYERKGGDRVIKMQLGSQAPQVLSQSRQEVFVHELVHAVMETPIEVPSAYKKRLEQLYGIAQKYLKPSDLTTGLNPTRTDMVKAKTVFDYIFNNTNAVQVDSGLAGGLVKRTVSNGLHEFVAFGLTNQNVITALNNLFQNNPQALREFTQGEKYSPLKGDPKSGLFVNALTMINEVFNYFIFKVKALMDKVNGLEGKQADQVLFELVTRIAHVERKQPIKYNKLGDAGNALMTKATDYVLNPISKVLSQSNFRIAQAIGGTMRLIPRLDSSNIGNMFNRVVTNFGETKDSIVASVAREMIGRTADNRNMANLLMLSREWIDKLRAETAAAASTMVRSAMHRDLTLEESGAIQGALMQTDAAVLFNGNTNDLISLVSDANSRAAEITKITDELTKLSPKYFQYFLNHSRNTAYYMKNKRSLYKGDVLFNANQIANLRSTGLTPDVDPNKVVGLIDKLISLHALNYTDNGTLSLASSFMKQELQAKSGSNSNGIQFLMDAMTNYKKQSKSALFQGSEELMVKGYIKETFNPNTGFLVVNDLEKAELERQGVEVIGFIPKDEHDNNQERVWLVKSDALAMNTRQRGAMSITNKKASGTNLLKAKNQVSESDINSLTAARDFAKIKSSRKAYNNAMLGQKPVQTKQSENQAVPVYDNAGNVAGYRYVMSETNRIAVAERVDLFDNTFGAMTASIADKVNTTKINKMIIDELYSDYRANYKNNPKLYTKISANSPDKENQEMWALIPKESRDYAKQVFGESLVYVSQDNYRRVFGYKKGDLGDLGNWLDTKFQNTYLESFGSMAKDMLNHKWTGAAENMWKEVVSFAKDRIVIVSGSVLLMNILSNMFVLAVEGVNPVDMIKYKKEGWLLLKEFQKDGIESKKLKIKLADTTLSAGAKKQIKARIDFLENKMTNNPVRPLLDRGVFQSIIEDVEMLDEQFSFKSKLERQLEPITDNIPDVVKDIGSAVFMTSNTSMYQFLRDATQMSDFVARYTLHKHNMNKGMDFEKSIDSIMDTFINYEEPSHKTVQWLNDVGLMMFTKFFLRVQKVILRQLKNKPLHMFGLWLVEFYLGVNLSTIDDSFVSPQDFINRFYTPLDSLETAITPPLPYIL